jgi:hypothetical protein
MHGQKPVGRNQVAGTSAGGAIQGSQGRALFASPWFPDRPPPRPEGLPPSRNPISYDASKPRRRSWKPAAECEVILARALSLTRLPAGVLRSLIHHRGLAKSARPRLRWASPPGLPYAVAYRLPGKRLIWTGSRISRPLIPCPLSLYYTQPRSLHACATRWMAMT